MTGKLVHDGFPSQNRSVMFELSLNGMDSCRDEFCDYV